MWIQISLIVTKIVERTLSSNKLSQWESFYFFSSFSAFFSAIFYWIVSCFLERISREQNEIKPAEKFDKFLHFFVQLNI